MPVAMGAPGPILNGIDVKARCLGGKRSTLNRVQEMLCPQCALCSVQRVPKGGRTVQNCLQAHHVYTASNTNATVTGAQFQIVQ